MAWSGSGTFSVVFRCKMFTFTSSAPLSDPSTYTYTRHHPDAEDDAFMDVDNDDVDDDGDKTAKLTSPGEPLTSAHAFMRFAFEAMHCQCPSADFLFDVSLIVDMGHTWTSPMWLLPWLALLSA